MSCLEACRDSGFTDAIEYGITKAYAFTRNWGVWEAFREFVQNALDEMHEVLGGRPEYYPCRVNELRWTVVYDRGRGLGVDNLLIGVSEKKPWQRGRFGEGLKIALLTLAAQDVWVWIRSRDKLIHPIIAPKTVEGKTVEVFCICYKSGEPQVEGTEILIPSMNLCDLFRDRFVQGLDKKCLLATIQEAEAWYDIIDKSCTAGESQVYVRDIYVSSLKEAVGRGGIFSYNLYNVRLDESRRVPSWVSVTDDMWSLFVKVLEISAIGDERFRRIARMYVEKLVEDCARDRLAESELFLGKKRVEELSRLVDEVVGADTVILRSLHLIDLAKYLRVKYVECHTWFGDYVEDELGHKHKLRELGLPKEMNVVTKDRMPEGFRRVVEILEQIADVLLEIKEREVTIEYAFVNKALGLARRDIRLITVNYEELLYYCRGNYYPCLEFYLSVVGHELAHIMSNAGDVTPEFERALTHIIGLATANAIHYSSKVAKLVQDLKEALKAWSQQPRR